MLSGKKILIVEDDLEIRKLLQMGLSEEGLILNLLGSGEQILSQISAFNPDLILLDIMLPGKSGFEICKEIRSKYSIPILFLSALDTPENVALGLDFGADDYLSKPFKFIELKARIRSLMRRYDKQFQEQTSLILFDDLRLDDVQKKVWRNNEEINLTTTEFKLLHLFMQYPKKVFSRSEIVESVWGVNFDSGTNVVDVYVNYLRKKMEINDSPRLIHTVVGMGYVLRSE